MTELEGMLLRQAYQKIQEQNNTIIGDPYRLKYHLMPPTGLLNDPNGLIHFKGIYHVFYQWNPFATAHGAKFWGHYTSEDLVNWKTEPIALAPSEWYEKNGCYSGSAVEKDGKLFLFYTGNVKDSQGNRETYQCLAVSEDGIHFEKKGPVITLPDGYTAHFRDPKVWKHEDSWYMIIGAQTLAKDGEAVLFTSRDLEKWSFLGPIAGSHKNGLGSFGYMWECPDLFRLNGKDVLLVSPQGLEPKGNLYHNLYQSGYFIGSFDYKPLSYRHGSFTELDRGFDFYAPQSFRDAKGRTILYGWMGITDENEPFQPTHKYNWVHALTIPREIKLRGNKLYQMPVEELTQIRSNEVEFDAEVAGSAVDFPKIIGTSIELLLEKIQLNGDAFHLTVRNNITISYDQKLKQLTLKRKSYRDGTIEERTCNLQELSMLHIFVDTSSVEIFVNGGEEVFTSRFFPSSENNSIIFNSNGKTTFKLKKWDII